MVATAGALVVWFVARDRSERVDTLIEQQGRVRRVEGTTPVVVGEPCSVRVEPAKGQPYNCRLVVRCGARTLYGAHETNGYASCRVEAGVAWHAEESVAGDSDPDIYYDVPSGQLTVKEPVWRVDIELTSLPQSPR